MPTEAHLTADPAELRAQLRDAGLRVTEPRLAVLTALVDRPHSDADSIFRMVHQQLPRTSLQAVYGVLAALTEARLVRRIEPAHSPALYERRRDDNHHHLVCRGCQRVLDIPCTVGAAPCLTPSEDHGFEVDEAEVTFWGFCPDCRADES